MNKTKLPPMFRATEKGVHVAVFLNDGKFSIKACKSYPTGKGGWKESYYFNTEQLVILLRLLKEAHAAMTVATGEVE